MGAYWPPALEGHLDSLHRVAQEMLPAFRGLEDDSPGHGGRLA
jgi:hypothetical protein